MRNKLDKGTPRPRAARRMVLVDSDVGLHKVLREHVVAQNNGWHLETHACPMGALKAIPKARPHVVLMDAASMRGGMDCLRNIKAHMPEVPVLLFVTDIDPPLLLKAMWSGARGCLIKPLPPADVLAHAHNAMEGGLALCPRAERMLLEGLHGMGRANTGSGLSPREREVMFCLLQQMRDKECAAALGISEGTVHAHVRAIFKKLKVRDRDSAIRKFIKISRRKSLAW